MTEIKKPCETDEFIAIICRVFDHTYDDYRIQDAVWSWNKGKYLEAINELPKDEAAAILTEDYVLVDKYNPSWTHIIGWEIEQ